jgi:hypothetical protein
VFLLCVQQTEVQRKTCVILSNVCRLVDDPKELSLAVPEILPMVRHAAENISKPEARQVRPLAGIIIIIIHISVMFGCRQDEWCD